MTRVPEVNQFYVDAFVERNFPRKAAIRALHCTGNKSFMAAHRWLYQHFNDPDFDLELLLYDEPLHLLSQDLLLEIAARLDRTSIGNLMLAWKFFCKNVVKNEDTNFWKKIVTHQLEMEDPGAVQFDWELFATYGNFFNCVGTTLLSDWLLYLLRVHSSCRMGAMYLGSNDVHLSTKCLNVVDVPMVAIKGIKPGIWIADSYRGLCPYCEFGSCPKRSHIFAWRHSDVLLLL